ncbi:MAG TPA: filamentous hemagglutinin N-terminal domain-containing protein, partial [Oscillatoriales cyanobacterium M4454_W2019_049]|nr:filamentous hemagglutinin N-terminal domain-containing protein [Oscillatoriales cyanobacterium M4454_W2019_049]
MKLHFKAISWGLSSVHLALAIALPAYAQSIVPSHDGTGTIVTPDGNRYDISGGQLSEDGRNLFQSFHEFGLQRGEVANFLSNPTIDNILGRVTGGNASYIDGLIQVSGGNSNLFLINPAGVIFGANASLNVPADFITTTATSIGFDSNTWLNSTGENNWSALVGTPNSFDFAVANPGAIVNEGTLTVTEGRTLGLIGGTIVNTGALQATGGNIRLFSVPGERLVRLSKPGYVLNLEVRNGTTGAPSTPTPLALPQLLTGNSTIANASQITVNPDGTVSLRGSGLQIDSSSGTTLMSGTADVSGTNGNAASIHILGDRVGLFGARLDASGTSGGGNIFIGGDLQGTGSLPTASRTYVDTQTSIFADALQQGNGGRAIVWADDSTRFYGTISARGGSAGGNGGFVEVSGKNWLDYQGSVDTFAPNGMLGTLLLDPTNIVVVADDAATSDLTTVDAFDDPDTDTDNSQTRINVAAIDNATANVTLQATNNITFGTPIEIFASGIGLSATAGNDIAANSSITTNGGGVTFDAGNNISIATGADITTAGGGVNFSADNNITSNGTISTVGGGVTLRANYDSSGSGRLSIGGSIITGGGSLNLSGTGNDGLAGIVVQSPLSTGGGNATFTGTGNVGRGIDLQGSLSTGGGTVNLTGTSTSAAGIWIGSSLSSGGGTMTLNGTSNGTGESARGIAISGTGALLSGGGGVNLTGSGSQAGISILSGGSIASGTGNLSLTSENNAIRNSGSISTSGTGNLSLRANSIAHSGSIATGTGNLTLTADSIALLGNVSGTGRLLLQPKTDIALGLGGTGDAQTVFLTGSELSHLMDGFSNITIGREDGSSNITFLGGATFSDPVTVRTLGAIDTGGFTLNGQDNASLTFNAGTNLLGSSLFYSRGQTINLKAGGNILVGAIDAGEGGSIILNATDGTVRIVSKLPPSASLYSDNISLRGSSVTISHTTGITFTRGDATTNGVLGEIASPVATANGVNLIPQGRPAPTQTPTPSPDPTSGDGTTNPGDGTTGDGTTNPGDGTTGDGTT